MEAYYDAQLDSEEASSPSAEKSETSGTQLSPEIEQFLSELGGRLDADPDE
jgi:hypothetical protein